MNCKPGDLAVVVRGQNAGVLVDVVEPHALFRGAWRVRVHSYAIGDFGPVEKGEFTGCMDSKLRPIRDPGEDARDETLSWLPVPSCEVVEA